MLMMRMRKFVLAVLVVVFSGWSSGASGTSVSYDPSLGSLPSVQGWNLEGVATPTPVVSGGVLLQGPTGDSQSWTKALTGLDFSAPSLSFVVEVDLRVIFSGFVLGGGFIPRAGYEISMGDSAGRLFTLFLSDDRVDLVNAGDGVGGVFSNFTTTDGFHNYRFSVDSGLGSLFIDNASTPLLSLTVGDSGWFPPNTVAFGDGTSAASSQTELEQIAFSVIPEPSTALLLGIGLSALAVRREKRFKMMMMRKSVVLIAAFFVLTASSGAGAVNIDWVTISDAGNVADDTGYGSVASSYRISRYEVTVGQYAEFLNAKASSDPYALFSTLMDTYQGITRQGTSGSYSYDVEVGRENRAMGHVSFANAVRLANWMNNGQGSASTEAGAYDISLGTLTSGAIQRDAGATIFLPSEDEWYKAAYYDSLSTSYFEYPTFSDSPGSCSSPTSAPNSANCNGAAVILTDVGSYSNSQSPYGTFDQGGNVWEWNESFLNGDSGGLRGGGNGSNQATGGWGDMRASYRGGGHPSPVPGGTDIAYGFRLGAVIPEPNTALLLGIGLSALAVRREKR